MTDTKINRIVICKKGKYNVFGDLRRCKICQINFTAVQPCIMCNLRIEKENEKGRKLTSAELRKLYKFLR